jgi:YQGE family putative transporter
VKSFILFEVVSLINSVFVGAYIFQKFTGPVPVSLYYIGNFLAIPIFFYVNGYLLKRVKILKLFVAGALLQGLIPVILVALPLIVDITQNIYLLFILGSLFGVGMAFYWANRNYLTIDSTTDNDRNYFFGLTGSLQTIVDVIMPLIIGFIIETLNHTLQSSFIGYVAAMSLGLIAVSISGYILRDNKFDNPQITSHVLKDTEQKSPEWNFLRAATVIYTFRYGVMLFVPAILVLSYIGKESKIGIIESTAALVAALFAYTLGRRVKAEKRIRIMLYAVGIFCVGVIFVLFNLSLIPIIAFIICLRLANPQFFTAISGMWYAAIDRLIIENKANRYKYICDLEVFIAIGRMIGIGLFLGLTGNLPQELALKILLAVIAVTQIVMYLILATRRKTI